MIEMNLSDAAGILGTQVQGEDIRFHGCSTDSRSIGKGAMFIALQGENFDGHDYVSQAIASGAVSALLERECKDCGVPRLVVNDARKSMGQLAAAWRNNFDLPLIAVTGSNGKTSVKEMLVSILSGIAPVLATPGNFNNDIGVPLTLFGLGKEHKYAVIEMGANHMGEISALTAIARPDVALITLCAPAHVEGFGSVDAVSEAKGEIFEGLGDDGVAVINADDKYASYWKELALDNKQITFGLSDSAEIRACDISLDAAAGTSRFSLQSKEGEIEINLRLPGEHNVRNAIAAAACCTALGISVTDIRQGLEAMSPVKGRIQIKQSPGGIRLVDDTYNANPASLEVALKSALIPDQENWLVLGDMNELGDISVQAHTEAGELAKSLGIKRLFTFGKKSEEASKSFGEGARHFMDREKLIVALKQDARAGISILVKGSRAMSMETVVSALMEEHS